MYFDIKIDYFKANVEMMGRPYTLDTHINFWDRIICAFL